MFDSTSGRAILLIIALATGLIIGICSGALSAVSGTHPVKSTLIAGATFAGTTTFILSLMQFLAD